LIVRKRKTDPGVIFANLAAALVFGAAAAWGIYVWTHPDYVPPCHEAPNMKGVGLNNCAFSRAYALSRPHH
jgi:hypothetical protein